MKKKLAIFVLSQFLLAGWADAQQAYFIDGYHGGIYGHYPVGQTAFIAQKLRQNPNWNINIHTFLARPRLSPGLYTTHQ